MTNKFNVTRTSVYSEEMVKASEFFTPTDSLLNKLRRKMSAFKPQQSYRTNFIPEVNFN